MIAGRSRRSRCRTAGLRLGTADYASLIRATGLRIRRPVSLLDFFHHCGEGIDGFVPRVRVRPLAVMPRQRFRQQPAPRIDAQPGVADVRGVGDDLGGAVGPAAHDPVVAAVVADFQDLLPPTMLPPLPPPLLTPPQTS